VKSEGENERGGVGGVEAQGWSQRGRSKGTIMEGENLGGPSQRGRC
jgi:hypothetical protein